MEEEQKVCEGLNVHKVWYLALLTTGVRNGQSESTLIKVEKMRQHDPSQEPNFRTHLQDCLLKQL